MWLRTFHDDDFRGFDAVKLDVRNEPFEPSTPYRQEDVRPSRRVRLRHLACRRIYTK